MPRMTAPVGTLPEPVSTSLAWRGEGTDEDCRWTRRIDRGSRRDRRRAEELERVERVGVRGRVWRRVAGERLANLENGRFLEVR